AQARLGGAKGVFRGIELRAADQLSLHQGLVALMLGSRDTQIGLSRSHLGADAFKLQAYVLRVEPGQRLVFTHPFTRLDQTLDDLAADAKRQLWLVAGVDLARVAGEGFAPRLRLDHPHWSYRGGLAPTNAHDRNHR